MKLITVASLSGGQGKTTSTLFLARKLAEQGKRVLTIDSDPQSSLTLYLRHEVKPDEPTLLEVIKREVSVEDGIYPTRYENIYLIPSDDALYRVDEYIANHGAAGSILQKRVQTVAEAFDYCLIDAPPQRSRICVTTLGSAEIVILPSEATSKGVESLYRTLATLDEMQADETFTGEVLGVVPFRDRWFGANQSERSKRSISYMEQTGYHLFPSILESERYKQAIDAGKTLAETGYPDLETPFIKIIEKLES